MKNSYKFVLIILISTLFPFNVKSQTSKSSDSLLIQADALRVMGFYEAAEDNYSQYLQSVYYIKNATTYYIYGQMGYCQYKSGKWEIAIPNLSRYLQHFGEGSNFTLASINENNHDIGVILIARGVCRAMLNDHRGAISDLDKGVSFLNKILKSPKYDFDEYRQSLGFGYCIRGLQKNIITNSKSGCEDIRKAVELGDEYAYKAIKSCD